ncbi:hypothetical protein V8C86DRAFT_2468676 [Haematococcus lacustris]
MESRSVILLYCALVAMAINAVNVVVAQLDNNSTSKQGPLSVFALWLGNCTLPGDSSCLSPEIATLDTISGFIASEVLDSPPRRNPAANLTTACGTSACTGSLTQAMRQELSFQNPTGACYIPASSSSWVLVEAVQRMVCTGATGSAGPAPGGCISSVAAALRSIELLSQVRALSSSLVFEGALLTRTCDALLPTGCCLKTWAYLMGAFSSQLCLPLLAQEFLSLPGRCGTATQQPVTGLCEEDWATFLQPALQSPPACTLPGAAASAAAMWSGTSCQADQLERSACPTSLCDVWCGLLGSVGDIDPIWLGPPGGALQLGPNPVMSQNMILFVIFFPVALLVILAPAVPCAWRLRHLWRPSSGSLPSLSPSSSISWEHLGAKLPKAGVQQHRTSEASCDFGGYAPSGSWAAQNPWPAPPSIQGTRPWVEVNTPAVTRADRRSARHHSAPLPTPGVGAGGREGRKQTAHQQDEKAGERRAPQAPAPAGQGQGDHPVQMAAHTSTSGRHVSHPLVGPWPRASGHGSRRDSSSVTGSSSTAVLSSHQGPGLGSPDSSDQQQRAEAVGWLAKGATRTEGQATPPGGRSSEGRQPASRAACGGARPASLSGSEAASDHVQPA